MRNTYLWLAQLVTGVLIAVTLGIHMAWMHLDTILGALGIDVNEPTSWTSMMERSREISWVALYVALLGFGLYHALYGLRNIIFEATKSPKARRTVTWVILVFGILAFAWGTYVPIILLKS